MPRNSKPNVEVSVVDTDILRRDPFKVANPDPEFVYRSAEDRAFRVQELEFMGYEIVEGKDAAMDPGHPVSQLKRTPDGRPPQPPGHVLMRIPRVLHDRREAAKDALLKRHEMDIKDKVRAFKKMMESHGGRGGAKLFSDSVDDKDLNV